MAKVNIDVNAQVNGIQRMDELGAKVNTAKTAVGSLAGGLEKFSGALGVSHEATKVLKDSVGVLSGIISSTGGAVGILVGVVGAAVIAFRKLYDTFSALYKSDDGTRYFKRLGDEIERADKKLDKFIANVKSQSALDKSRSALSGDTGAEGRNAERLQSAINAVDKRLLELKTAAEHSSKEIIAGRISNENFIKARKQIAEDEAKWSAEREKLEIELNGSLVKLYEEEKKMGEAAEKAAEEAAKAAEEKRKDQAKSEEEAAKAAEAQKQADEKRAEQIDALLAKISNFQSANTVPDEMSEKLNLVYEALSMGYISLDKARLEFADLRGQVVSAADDLTQAQRENTEAQKKLEQTTRAAEEARKNYTDKQKELLDGMTGQLQTALAENASKLSNDFGTGIRSATDTERGDRFATSGKTIHALERQLEQQRRIANDSSRTAIERERANAKIEEIKRVADGKIGKGILEAVDNAKKNGTTPSERAKARKDAIKEAQEAQAKAIQDARKKMQAQMQQKADAEAAAKATADNLYNLMKKYFKGAQLEKPKAGIV